MNAQIIESVLISIVATLVIVPLAMVSALWMLRLLLRQLGVPTAQVHEAVQRMLQNPVAFAHFLGAGIVGVCILLGQVYR